MIPKTNSQKRLKNELINNLELIIAKINRGELKLALHHATRLRKKFPKSANLLNTIGAIHFKRGKKTLAIAFYKKAISIAPDSFENIYNLGVALNATCQYNKALVFLTKAVKLNANSVVAHHSLGTCYKNLKNSQSAIASYQDSLLVRSDHVPTLNDLGILYSQIGQNKKAEECFQKILTIRPNWSMAHRHLSLVTDYKKNQKHILELENLLKKKLNPLDEIQIRYAFYRASSATGKINRAFKNLLICKNLRKEHSNYNFKEELKIFEKIKSVSLRHKEIRTTVSSDSKQVNPIFVVGMPRSGTTLVEQILGSHSEVFGGGEIPILGNKLYPQFAKKNIELIFPSNESLNELHRHYHTFVNQLVPNTKYFVDKMPTNFLWLGFVNKIFPNASIINVRRDPMAVVWSNFKHYFSSRELSFSNNLNDIVTYYKAYESLMNFWRLSLGHKIYELNYENLTKNPKTEIKKLLKFCRLEWEDSCIYFYKRDNLVQTASRSQIRKPIYKGSSNEWKIYYKQLASIEKQVRSSLGTDNKTIT